MCSYCAIPLITGRHTSRPMEELIQEAEWLRDQGVQELNVIAQDLSSYGLDLYNEHKLPELVEQLANIDGIRWIRLHYAYPTDFPDELLDVMAKHDNVCKYLDIALQHCTTHMLQKMRRLNGLWNQQLKFHAGCRLQQGSPAVLFPIADPDGQKADRQDL